MVQASTEPLSYKTIAAAGSLIAIITSICGLVWYQSALASQVATNTASIQKLEVMPERLIRVETKVDLILEELHAEP